MKRLFSWLFPKYEVRHISFYNATAGMKQHDEFIEHYNKGGIQIINSFITYHNYEKSHIPQGIHYVIKFKK